MSILLEKLTKRYDGQPVVNNLSLEINDGEFFVLLGSSGSGKTTVLNLIAGLTVLDQGRISLHGRDVTYLPTRLRRVGFVFQNYALFQYMTVAQNIEFGLSIHKVPRLERGQRRDELLDLVGLSGFGNRLPRQLSGGQQQRVALARALAYQPDVLLLDEPLGALDAKIRIELRRSLKDVQRKLGITTILVTHDQEEAFDLADRLGVMSFGRLLEVGTPEELYQRPKSEFVATFLGSANLMVGRSSNGSVHVGPVQVASAEDGLPLGEAQRVQVLFRPEDVALSPTRQGLDCPNLGLGEVTEVAFGGSFERLRLRLPSIPGVRSIAPPVTYGSDSILIDATRSPDEASRFPVKTGEKTWVGVRRIHTLAHPGLSFLIVTDGSLRANAAISLGGQIGRLAHARVTLLGCANTQAALEAHLQAARKQIGSGLGSLQILVTTNPIQQAVREAVEQEPHDLIIIGFEPQGELAIVEQILKSGDQHLLLAPAPQPPPTQALVCVAGGEPGKDDVLFASRFLRHLGAEVTLMTIAPSLDSQGAAYKRAERFLENGVKTLSILGVPSHTAIRSGPVSAEILAEVNSGNYDLLVLGAPLANHSGEISLNGVVDQVLRANHHCATLIVRSHFYKRHFSIIEEDTKPREVEEVRR